MKEIVDMWVDKDGYLFFESYFLEQDAEKLKEFIEKELGYQVILAKDDKREFKPYPAIWKKNVVRDIDWNNYQNILYIINNRDRTDEDIVKGLHSEGSGFSITVKRGVVMTEYAKLLELEGRQLTEDKKIEFAKSIANKFMKGKRVNVGQNVITDFRGQKIKGKIINFIEGKYKIELEDGSFGFFKRDEFELD